VESVFHPSEFSGLVFGSAYLETGGFFELKPPNNAGSPLEGNWASLQWSQFISQTPGITSFSRTDVQLQRSELFLNQQRAVVLRTRAVLTSPKSRSVPFYLQPELGGPDNLRGFRGRRFYDNNLFSATAEYQWQIMSEVSLALFADVGKVFPRWNDWSLQHMEHSFGAGIRFGPTGVGGGRIDLAASREGVQFWVVFANF
jgi:outer membrane protein assembly factor BamA